MKRRTLKLFMLVCCLGCIQGCGLLGGDKKENKAQSAANPGGASGIPPELRKRDDSAGTVITPGGNEAAVKSNLSEIVSDDDLIFTDPDNPNENLPELAAILENKKRGPWESSEAVAKQRAVSEGKALLIWFTDSAKSPMCLALSQELFSKHEFGDWASEKIVRLRVDLSAQLEDPNLGLDEQLSQDITVKQYVAKLRKKYKVLGNPTLIMTEPSGKVLLRRSGYKRGEAKFVMGQIQHAEAVSNNSYQSWKKSLESRGYRDWSDQKGRKVFAKLVNYSNGTLTFLEPSGRRSRTSEKMLSAQDRTWIDEQKKLRGIE